jgi:hypothetical protein
MNYRPFTLLPLAMLAVLLLAANVAAADNTDAAKTEIQYLLDAIGTSGCAFVRNGTEHPSPEAQDHLAMKYRRGKKYAKTAEQFIERLASKSSWTGKPYLVACPDEPAVDSGVWLTQQLMILRMEQ